MLDSTQPMLIVADILIVFCCLATVFVLWRARCRNVSSADTDQAHFHPQMAEEFMRQQMDAALADIASTVAEQRAQLANPVSSSPKASCSVLESKADVIPLTVGNTENQNDPAPLPDRAETRMAQHLANRRMARQRSAQR